MLGTLPRTLEVNGVSYNIRTDFRDILRIFSALNAPELSDKEKAYVLMKQMYMDLEKIPKQDYQAAFDAAFTFIECHAREDRPSPKVVNWDKDEQLIFPAINKVAGREIRAEKYVHWWTFLGYFQGIDPNDTWGYILMLRQKKAKHRQLEKHEREFWNANRALCAVDTPKTDTENADDALTAIYNDLLKGGVDGG